MSFLAQEKQGIIVSVCLRLCGGMESFFGASPGPFIFHPAQDWLWFLLQSCYFIQNICRRTHSPDCWAFVLIYHLMVMLLLLIFPQTYLEPSVLLLECIQRPSHRTVEQICSALLEPVLDFLIPAHCFFLWKIEIL